MILNSPGTLQFYLSEEEQHRNKPYAYGHRAPITIERNQVPPFQIVIPVDYAAVNSVLLVSRETGTETEIFSAMTGIETKTFADYKIVRYPASVLISGGLMGEGVYYVKLSNGSTTWYSEEFCMKASVSDLWKIEYCHSEDFELGGTGHIDYTDGYKNYFLVKTEIGKPQYNFEDEVARRDGKNFPLQQMRIKAHLFELILPEEVIDAMSLIPLHDTVVISRGTRVYDVDEITLEVDWLEQGDLAAVTFFFFTDTVVIINGRGVTTVDCGAVEGACFEVAFEAVAFIYEGSAEWDGEYYTTPGGVQVPFAEGDLVVVYERPSEDVVLYIYTGGTFVVYPTTPGDYIYEQNTGLYFYDQGESSLLYNHITEIIGEWVYGQALPGSTVQVYALLATGGEVLVGIGTGAEFSEFGLEFEVVEGMIALKIVVGTAACPAYYVGPWIYLEPLELLACSGDYPSDEDAITGGVLPGEYYCLTIDNVFGMPAAVIKRLPPFTGYASDAGALAVLGANVAYEMAAGNDLGVPSGTVRINVDGLDVYDDDADAASGGVAVGELYIWNCLVAGFQPYLIKKREV